ncbi:Uncharacterised protein [Mycobacteroides abscessus]|nr:Uncharacterised protein [Mycobacteroides abscessus]
MPCGSVAGIGTPRPPTFAAGSKPVPRTTIVSPTVTGVSPRGVVPSAASTEISGSHTGASGSVVNATGAYSSCAALTVPPAAYV